jgi:hypothetical protein
MTKDMVKILQEQKTAKKLWLMGLPIPFSKCTKYTFFTKGRVPVPYHGGGRRKYINAWYLNTHMVYL